jgi:membrane peptidoglycan carboxypeptidase
MGDVLPWHRGFFGRAQKILRRHAVPVLRRLDVGLRFFVFAAVVGLVGWAAVGEARSSFLQSLILARWARTMTFVPVGGLSPNIRFPTGGPYDRRLGYASLPDFIGALRAHGYGVERQAVISPALARFTQYGYPPYQEENQAGLTLYDSNGTVLHAARYPEAIYNNFAEIPPLVVDTLLFIEDRHLLEANDAHRDPAIDWGRFLVAAMRRMAGVVDPHLRGGGASTLATQIEKFRHSPEGRTDRITEKLRQMVSAALLAYRHGPDTLEARRRIVVTYLNATPLASQAGFGEVIGIGDALAAWFGTDLADANRVLQAPAYLPAELARKARIYREVLSLLLAERRPSYYLQGNHQALDELTDHYLDLLAGAHVISTELYEAARAAKLHMLAEALVRPCCKDIKATDALRTELLDMLGVSNWYDLDRLDLAGYGTIELPSQQRVSQILAQVNDPAFVVAHHLVGRHLLQSARDLDVNYSVVVYERDEDGNHVRVHADSLNEPFDINSGAKLILGSTAKLRTLVTYLNIVTALHDRYAQTPKADLVTHDRERDPLTTWAMTWLSNAPNRALRPMLDAAMQRRYSAAPGDFFTNGGMHPFHNFEKWEDETRPTVEVAFENSINLAFVRLMHDIREYFIARNQDAPQIMADPHDEVREEYLHRFADEEGRRFVHRFYRQYRGLQPPAILGLVAHHARAGLERRVALFRAVRPSGSMADLHAFLEARSPSAHPDEEALSSLYYKYGPDRFSLADQAHIAGIHPLEIGVASLLLDHPGATEAEVQEATATERQAAYVWLFKTRSRHKQDVRLRILLEEDAFNQILEDWQRQGYPFGHLVPSLSTAIGSSGDRPDALATLIGIILDGGVRKPTTDFERLAFAVGTPYETSLAPAPSRPQRVMAPEAAEAIKQALLGVVQNGTANGLLGAYLDASGAPMVVGGKTGTGDNRLDTFASGGWVTSSRPVDRTATFAFFLGDRFYGTVTAYVAGPQAGHYDFTSALAVQVLRLLEPALMPLVRTPPGYEGHTAETSLPGIAKLTNAGTASSTRPGDHLAQ